MRDHNYFVYITTNFTNSTLYIGVTNDLEARLQQHTDNKGLLKTFAGRYHCCNLIYWERYQDVVHAIEREKQLKKWSRSKKNKLIESMNPEWEFLNINGD